MSEPTIEITSIDSFAQLLASWHANRLNQLEQAMNVPDDVAIEFTDENGEVVTLTAEQRAGFKAGMTIAKSLFEELPFVFSQEDAPEQATEETANV